MWCLPLALLAMPLGSAATGFGPPAKQTTKPAKKQQRGQNPADNEVRRQRRLGKDNSLVEVRKKLFEKTMQQPFSIGDYDVDLVIPSYVMDAQQFQSMVEIGAGTVCDIVWPAEEALARTLVERSYRWKSTGVLEIGAGLGLAGIVAAVAGAPKVLLTDREKLTLGLAMQSAARNEVGDKVSVSAFDWSDRSKWPTPWGGLVVGADVLYDEEVVDPLLDLIEHLGSSAMLMEPDNIERQQLGSIARFQERGRLRGLHVDAETYVDRSGRGSSPMLLISVSKAGPSEVEVIA